MKAHTYYVIFGRPPIGGGAFPLLPLAAPLVVVVVVSLIITLSTAKQHQFCRLKLYEVKHNISLNDDGQHVPCRFT